MNVDFYLKRINFSGNLKPGLELLKQLQKTHLMSVPFENLDIHSNRAIVLDYEKVFEKVVNHNRGGFCYELNGLFHELLVALGFESKMISACVFIEGRGYGVEYDHMALVVTIEGKEYLADAGFGEFVFEPLALSINEIQQDSRGDYVIQQYDESYLRVGELKKGELIPQYIFQNKERAVAEFAEMCHYHQTSVESHFLKGKMISRPTENGRITLANNKLKIKKGEKVKDIVLKGEDGFERALWRYFEIKM